LHHLYICILSSKWTTQGLVEFIGNLIHRVPLHKAAVLLLLENGLLRISTMPANIEITPLQTKLAVLRDTWTLIGN
jgi:hypothetical protein